MLTGSEVRELAEGWFAALTALTDRAARMAPQAPGALLSAELDADELDELAAGLDG